MTKHGESAAATAWDQRSYQVRFDWGLAGLRRLAPADLTVVVDVLGFSASALEALTADGDDVTPLPAGQIAQHIAHEAVAAGSTVVLACLRNVAAVAQAALAEQVTRGVRTSIAVIAVPAATSEGEIFAVENLLGAGAVIDALATLGTDHSSPEAAVACEGFAGLRRAVGHLISASGSGRDLVERGLAEHVATASVLNDSQFVPVVSAHGISARSSAQR